MSVDNPDLLASDIITDVENRLGTTDLDTTDYIPWISYAYLKTYLAISAAGQQAKEYYFGAYSLITLTAGIAEYDLDTYIPRFGGFIKVEVRYGGTSDDWVVARRLKSLSNWKNQANVTETYQPKISALYYKLGNNLGFIPTPPTTDSGTPTAKVWYVKRPYQIEQASDVIDIPYRYTYPITDYVQAKAIMAENEDYAQAGATEQKFDQQLFDLTGIVTDEFNENDGTSGIQVPVSAPIFRNPLRSF